MMREQTNIRRNNDQLGMTGIHTSTTNNTQNVPPFSCQNLPASQPAPERLVICIDIALGGS